MNRNTLHFTACLILVGIFTFSVGQEAVVQTDLAVAQVNKTDKKKKDNGKISEIVRAKLKKSKTMEKQMVLFKSYMNARINEIDEICDLKETQKKRLQLAAKGAIRTFSKKWEDGVVSWFINFAGLRNFAGNNNEEQMKQMAEQMVNENMMRQFNMISGARFCSDIIAREKIWANNVEKALTPAQREKYTAHRTALKKRDDELQLSALLNTIGHDLMLNKKQKSDLQQLIQAEIKKIPKVITHHAIYGNMIVLAKTYQIPKEKAAKILDESQLNIWNDRKQTFGMFGDFDQEISRMMGPWGAVMGLDPPKPVGFLRGAAAADAVAVEDKAVEKKVEKKDRKKVQKDRRK